MSVQHLVAVLLALFVVLASVAVLLGIITAPSEKLLWAALGALGVAILALVPFRRA